MKFNIFSSILIGSIITMITACGDSSNSAPPAQTPAAEVKNIPPTIASQTIEPTFERENITISAVVNDSDGTISSYEWLQTSGTPVLKLISDNDKLSFLTPDIAANETLTFTLTVTDNNSGKTTQTFSLDINAYPTISLSEITDPGLRECLRNTSLDTGIKSISCNGFVIASMLDLYLFENLHTLSLINADITDITELVPITTLTALDLSDNRKLTLNNGALNQLTSLKSLNLNKFVAFKLSY